VLFESDVFDFVLQNLGGLKGNEILGIYKDKTKAESIARSLLN